MFTLLKVVNRRPVDLISPFLVHEEQITSVGSTGDNSSALARFSCTIRVFSAFSEFFMRFPRFATFAICNAMRCIGSCLQHNTTHLQCIADTDRESCGLLAHLELLLLDFQVSTGAQKMRSKLIEVSGFISCLCNSACLGVHNSLARRNVQHSLLHRICVCACFSYLRNSESVGVLSSLRARNV